MPLMATILKAMPYGKTTFNNTIIIAGMTM